MAAFLLGLTIAAYKRSHPYAGEAAISRYGIGKDAGDSAEEELLIERDRININTADTKTLRKLKGVGVVLAGRIVDYRDSNGPFGTIDDIKKVKGVGKALFEKIRDRIAIE